MYMTEMEVFMENGAHHNNTYLPTGQREDEALFVRPVVAVPFLEGRLAAFLAHPSLCHPVLACSLGGSCC
jgi:hypothetical protein